MNAPACRPLFALVLVTAVLGAGCLGGGNAPTRLYVLAPVETPALPASGALSVGVGPMHVPGYLDRPQIVTRRDADRIDLGDFDQWGEPLRDGISACSPKIWRARCHQRGSQPSRCGAWKASATGWS